MSVAAIVLAAGRGTRMKSDRPKVAHRIAGRAMVSWVLDAVAAAGPDRVVVVIGHEAETVEALLPDDVTAVVQDRQLGTGHATQVALAELQPAADDVVLVLPGDAPLVKPDDLQALLDRHRAAGAAATLLTAELDDPTGYGRVLRAPDGSVTALVEHGDAASDELEVREVTSSIYAFAAGPLTSALQRLEAHDVQGELDLTDVVGLLAGESAPLAAEIAAAEDVAGVDSQEQLAAAARVLRRRINAAWMREGVGLVDPDAVYIDAEVILSAGARIYPGVHLEGATSVATGAEIGPDCHVRDSRIGEDAVVRYAVLDGVVVEARAQVGPYASLRAGTVLGPEAKAGTFVEMKKTTVGPRSKVPHLSYMGDATIGEDSNVGAGSITCNWDGDDKHPTHIGDRVKIGSDTMLVAPLAIGDDAYTGAGSVISRNVAPGSLAVERSPQKEVRDYAARRRLRRRRKSES